MQTSEQSVSALVGCAALAILASLVATIGGAFLGGSLVAGAASESGYVALLGDDGCIVTEWHLVDTAVHGSPGGLSFRTDSGLVRVAGSLVYLENPSAEDVAAVSRMGPCVPAE